MCIVLRDGGEKGVAVMILIEAEIFYSLNVEANDGL